MKQKHIDLSINAYKIRKLALEAVYNASSGHPGGSMSIADIMACLYFDVMKHDPKNPKWDDRDRFVLSKGHCAPALYGTLALAGYYAEADVKSFRSIASHMQGHPSMKDVPGVDMSTGSLGQGISAACGMAKSAKLRGKDYRVYTILGDGELEEGQVWEAAMFAGHYKLDNLCAIVDYNGMQIDGLLKDVCSPEPIADKFAAFNWHVVEIDAHDIKEILKAFEEASEQKGKPTVIVAKSVKGKGISYMEGDYTWHGKAPNKEQYETAAAELDNTIAKLKEAK